MHWLNESYVKQCNTYMWAHERLISYGFIERFDKLRTVSLLAGLLFSDCSQQQTAFGWVAYGRFEQNEGVMSSEANCNEDGCYNANNEAAHG
jgi:hypothetical protein